MEKVLAIFSMISAFFMGPNGAILFAVLFAISEALGGIPQIQSSSVYQVVFKALKWLKDLTKKQSQLPDQTPKA